MTSPFNLESFYQCLRTKKFGRPCVFLDKVSSTIDVIAAEKPNTLVLAREQTLGRGQRSNTWESPAGCAMGSMRVVCSKDTGLARRVNFLQHILALSAAQTLESIDSVRLGREQIGLKWPNDIIYKKDNLKLGGILINAQQLSHLDIVLSFGLNVDNRKPTICVNEILAGTDQQVSIERVVAGMMNHLENYIARLDDDKEFNDIKQDYENRCLQVGKIVLDEHAGTIKVTGVNEEGYLVGKSETADRICVVRRII